MLMQLQLDWAVRQAAVPGLLRLLLWLWAQCLLGCYISFTYWISAMACQFNPLPPQRKAHTASVGLEANTSKRTSNAVQTQLPLNKRTSFTKTEQKHCERSSLANHERFTKEQAWTLWTQAYMCIILKQHQIKQQFCKKKQKNNLMFQRQYNQINNIIEYLVLSDWFKLHQDRIQIRIGSI